MDDADSMMEAFTAIAQMLGGGAALLWEKIVATNSNKIVWIVDESKVVDTIGKFPLPVEVIPFGAGQVVKKFEAKGYKPVLRLDARTTMWWICTSSASTTRRSSRRTSSPRSAWSSTACS